MLTDLFLNKTHISSFLMTFVDFVYKSTKVPNNLHE
jgi:hypothetical protein